MTMSGLELPSGKLIRWAVKGVIIGQKIAWRLPWHHLDLRGQWLVRVTLPDGTTESQLAIVDRQLGVRARGRVRGYDSNGAGPLEYDVQLRWETISTVSYHLRGGGGPGEGHPTEYSSGLLRVSRPDAPTDFEGLAVATERPGGELIPIKVHVAKQ